MGDSTHLERMGRELKCPICWSLLNSAVSLTCNHVFCNSCILKSMKSGSSCPVCKVPFQRREVRPAPHMNNLVSIYKSMEVASGINIFVTQSVPVTKLSDGEKQCEGDANCIEKDTGRTPQNHVQRNKPLKKKGSRKKIGTSMNGSGAVSVKPSFPTKKRVQVPHSPLTETPLKISMFGSSLSEINKEGAHKGSIMSKERPQISEKEELVLSPFFWLRDDDDEEKLSQHNDGDQVIDTPTPKSTPSFSDLKDSDGESPYKFPALDEVQDKPSVDLFDSEMFEWTQRPCSPELCSSPFKMQLQVADNGKIEENQGKDLVAASQDQKANHTSIENGKLKNSKEGNGFPYVLPCVAASPQIRSSDNLNGKEKPRKRDRKAIEKAQKEQTVKTIDVDSDKLSKVNQNQGWDGKCNSLKETNRRGKRVRFNASTKSTPQTASAVSDISGVQSKREAKIINYSPALPCEKEHEKDFTLSNARKSQRKVKKVDYVQSIVEELSSMQNQTNEYANSLSSNSSLMMDNNRMVSDRRQKDNSFYRNAKFCNRELKSTKKLKLSSDCFSQQKYGEEIQPNERKLHNHHVTALNDPSKENRCSFMDEVNLRKCETHIEKYQCAFCLSSEESEASGQMVHYYNGKPVTADNEGGSNVIHSHRNCTEWAPNVYFKDDIAINLEAEIARSRRIKCSLCGLKGAALGCCKKSCRRSFHVPCAKRTSQCRWDMDNFVMLCPLHATSKLPCETSESQERSKNRTTRESSAFKCNKVAGKLGTRTSQNQAAHDSYKKIVLCCSALSTQERDIVSEFQRVTKVAVLKKWDPSITHVIASTDENGACRRTLKVLLGILEGKWILNMEWIKASMTALKPVDEEGYEITIDIHGTRDGPHLGRLRVLNKQPKLFDGYKFYLMGDFTASYKGYLQDLVTAAGGIILHRKPLSGLSSDMYPSQTFIIYCLELPDKCNSYKKDTILSRRRCDAEALASLTGSKVASNTWILNSIAACKLRSLAE